MTQVIYQSIGKRTTLPIYGLKSISRAIAVMIFLLLSTLVYGQAQKSLPVIKLIGTFGYDYNEGTIIIAYSDSLKSDTLSANIKWRGASTNTPDRHKRNYKIKLTEDHQLFGLRSDNNWILDAGQADVFRLRNHIATNIWNDFAHKPYYVSSKPEARSGVRGEIVEVYLNDEYQGIYCFTENMDRKQMQVKKYDSKTLQIRGCLWKAKDYGLSTMRDRPGPYDNSLPTWECFEAKYPEPGDDLENTDYGSLWRAIEFTTTSTDSDFQDHVAEFFDVPVIMDYYLFLNVLGAMDNVGKNTYWAIFDQTQDSRLTLAVWDLDGTIGQHWFERHNPELTNPKYDMGTMFGFIDRLLRLNPNNFRQQLYERYTQLRATIFDKDSLVDRYTACRELLRETGADQREIQRWSGDTDIDGRTIDFDDEIQYITDWIKQRIEYLDVTLAYLVSGVSNQQHQSFPDDEYIYSLNGQKLTTSTPLRPGIYIRGNRKIVIK